MTDGAIQHFSAYPVFYRFSLISDAGEWSAFIPSLLIDKSKAEETVASIDAKDDVMRVYQRALSPLILNEKQRIDGRIYAKRNYVQVGKMGYAR